MPRPPSCCVICWNSPCKPWAMVSGSVLGRLMVAAPV